MVNKFTDEDDRNLAIYIARNDAKEVEGRMRKKLYKQLVENSDRWPWSVRHTWMNWMTRYIDNHERFNRLIHALQEENSSDCISQSPSPHKPSRTEFTANDDKNLVRFLAKVTLPKHPNAKHGRSGSIIYRNILVVNPQKFSWANTHTWQSWRNRYVKRREHFDTLISQWQERHGIVPDLYKNTLEDTEEKLDLRLGQTDEQLYTSNESQHNAKRGTKRRRLEKEEEEEEESITDTVPDSLPLPKRQKTSPSSNVNETEEPTEIVQRDGSKSPVGVDNGINPGEGQGDMDQLVAVSGRQDPGACEVGKDKKRDERSPHLSDHSDDQKRSVRMHKDCREVDKTLSALPKANNISEDPHVLVPPNTPMYLQKLNNQSPAPSNQNNTSADVHISNTTPMDVQVHMKQTTSSPPPPEPSPAGIPGINLDISGDAIEVPKLLRHLISPPITVGRSHHPTPPSTNVQSEWSLQSPSTVSDSSMLTAKAEGKNCHSPSVFPVYVAASPSPSFVEPAVTYPDQLVETRLTSVKTPLFPSPISSDSFLGSPPLPRRTPDLQELKANSPPHSPGRAARNRTPKKEDGGYESGPEGPFVSSPASPRRIQVIHGLPKPRPGMSFGGNSWVRERRVVPGSITQKSLKREATGRKWNDDKDTRSHKAALVHVQEAQAEKRRSNLPRLLDVVGGKLSTEGSTKNDTVYQHLNRSASSGNSKHVNSGQQNVIAPGPSPVDHESYPISGSEVEDIPGVIPNQSHHFKEDDMAMGSKVTDVFRTLTPVASGNTRDPYVLNTTHLPEPSSSSAVSRVQLDSPVPLHKARDKLRRRTFAGFKSRSSLPSIDLMKKLDERASTRTATQLRTRRTSLDTTSMSDSIASIVCNPLAAPERSVTRCRPPRSSVIPIIADPEFQRPASALLPKWSPSTYNHVIRAGLGAIFKRMEENHGFSTSVVQRAWLQQNMDLDATDRLLLRMRIAAENALHGSNYAEQQHVLASNKAFEGAQSEVLSVEDTAPDPGAISDDYTPPARSRAEQYRKLSERGQWREARQREIDLVSRGSSKSSTGKKILPPAVWGAQHDEVLRSGDKAKLEKLADKFGEDTVRRRFLIIMRESHVMK